MLSLRKHEKSTSAGIRPSSAGQPAASLLGKCPARDPPIPRHTQYPVHLNTLLAPGFQFRARILAGTDRCDRSSASSRCRVWRRTRTNVGLINCVVAPHPMPRPCANTVLPAPRLPCNAITAPPSSIAPSRAPTRRVCSGLRLINSRESGLKIGITRSYNRDLRSRDYQTKDYSTKDYRTNDCDYTTKPHPFQKSRAPVAASPPLSRRVRSRPTGPTHDGHPPMHRHVCTRSSDAALNVGQRSTSRGDNPAPPGTSSKTMTAGCPDSASRASTDVPKSPGSHIRKTGARFCSKYAIPLSAVRAPRARSSLWWHGGQTVSRFSAACARCSASCRAYCAKNVRSGVR